MPPKLLVVAIDDDESNSNTWVNDMITPDCHCAQCKKEGKDFSFRPTNDGAGVKLIKKGPFAGRPHFVVADIIKCHFQKGHTPSITGASIKGGLYKATYEETQKAHATGQFNALQTSTHSLINCFCRKGLPDSLIADPSFVAMVNDIVTLGRLPMQSATKLVEDRTTFATSLRSKLFSFCKNSFVSVQIDSVTRGGNRFIGTVLTVYNSSQPTLVAPVDINANQMMMMPQARLPGIGQDRVKCAHPARLVYRTFLFDLRSDKQAPFTKLRDDDGVVIVDDDEDVVPVEPDERAAGDGEIALLMRAIEDENADAADGDEEQVPNDVEAERPQGQMTTLVIAEYLDEILKNLKSVGAVILGITSDNGSNMRGVVAALRNSRGSYQNDIRCFAHLIQLVGNKWFGLNNTEPDVRSHNNVMLACVDLRKWLRTTKNIYVPEPVITRWNSFYNMIKEILDRFVTPWCAHHADNAAGAAPFEDVIVQLAACWPTQRNVGTRAAAQAVGTFVRCLAPINKFTNIVQNDSATLGVGIAALSEVFGTVEVAYKRALKNRLINPYGRFLSDPFVIFLALIPWKTWDDRTSQMHLKFLNHVKNVLKTVSAFPADPNVAPCVYRSRVHEAFKGWVNTMESRTILRPNVPHSPKPTLQTFIADWEVSLRSPNPKIQTLAHFALSLVMCPVSEAGVERAFSAVKYIVDNLRFKTTPQHVFDQVIINQHDNVKQQRDLVFFADEDNDLTAVVRTTPISSEFVTTCVSAWTTAVDAKKIVIAEPRQNNEQAAAPQMLDHQDVEYSCAWCHKRTADAMYCGGRGGQCVYRNMVCGECCDLRPECSRCLADRM